MKSSGVCAGAGGMARGQIVEIGLRIVAEEDDASRPSSLSLPYGSRASGLFVIEVVGGHG